MDKGEKVKSGEMRSGSSERYYDIHGLMRFLISGSLRQPLLSPINWEFSYFETSDQDYAPDIIINLGKFVPANNDCYLVDNKYYVRRNYLYCSDAAARARWEVEISGFESGITTVNFNGRRFGKEEVLYPDLLAQDLILKPLLEYKLSKVRALLIHAGAVSKNGLAYLLAGRGGAHKTTLAMGLVKEYGFQLMADDQVIIQDSRILSFPKHIAQLSFKIKNMSTEEYSLVDKLRILGFMRRGQFDLQMPSSAALQTIVFVSRSNNNKVRTTRIPNDVAVKKLVVNNMIDMNRLGVMSGLFLRYMHAYSFVFPNSAIAQYWSNLGRSLSEALSSIPIYEMLIPETFTPESTDSLVAVFQGSV